MTPRFRTKQDAIEAGYTPVNRRTDKDVSGPNAYGYQFQNADGETTVDVHLTGEKNQIGNDMGAFVPMYPPRQ